jgi:hypothetical protein
MWRKAKKGRMRREKGRERNEKKREEKNTGKERGRDGKKKGTKEFLAQLFSCSPPVDAPHLFQLTFISTPHELVLQSKIPD